MESTPGAYETLDAQQNQADFILRAGKLQGAQWTS